MCLIFSHLIFIQYEILNSQWLNNLEWEEFVTWLFVLRKSAKMSSISYCIPVHVLYQQVFYYLSLCTINSALQYKTGSSWSVQKLFPLNNNKGAKETKFLFNSIWIWINEVWLCEKSLLLSEARKDFLRSSI